MRHQLIAVLSDIALPLTNRLVGFMCGLVFAVLATLRDRGQPIADVPLTRVIVWGIVVAALVPVLTGKVVPEVLVIAPLGALSALVSVAIMRRWAALRPAA